TLARAMEQVAGRVEQLHHVSVEVVTVGDAPIDDRLQALLQACGEAMTNAARHAGVTTMSVYVEALDGAVTAYIRDRGLGFDPTSVSTYRRGIAESIRGRMQRAGGTAEISSRPGSGTEVKLTLPTEKR